MKKVIWVLIGIPLLFFAFVLLLNWRDEELSPAAREMLSRRVNVPPAAVSAYKYYLGMPVASSQDPSVKGSEIYNRLREAATNRTSKGLEPISEEKGLVLPAPAKLVPCESGSYCSEDNFLKNEGRFKTVLSESEEALERFHNWIKFGAYASDLQPSLLVPLRISFWLALAKIEFLQLSQLVNTGHAEEALQRLDQFHHFFASSLEYPRPLIEVMLIVSMLEREREFITEAAKANFKFRKLLTAQALTKFDVRIDFEKLNEKWTTFEARTFEDVLTWPVHYTKMDWQGSGEWSRWKQMILALLPSKPNQTLNEYVESLNDSLTQTCIKANQECSDEPIQPVGFSLVNPFGRDMLQVFSPKVSVSVRKLYQKVDKLNQRFSLSGTLKGSRP